MDTTTLTQGIAFLREHPSTFLATVAGQDPWVRAMWVARMDDDGTLWYATGVNSDKVAQVQQNPHVCVAGGEERHGVRVFGTAEVVTDPAQKAALWEESWTAYFAGPDDPAYALLKIIPTRLEIW